MCKMNRFIISCLFTAMLVVNLKAQISEGGQPYSKSLPSLKSTATLPRIELSNLDAEKLLKEDMLNPVPFRYAIFRDTIIDIKVSGKADIIPDKGRIWRLRISSESARSLQIIFSSFVLPKAACLYLYDDNQTLLAGAFTRNNNQPDSTLVLADFKGNHVIIEYFEPINPEFDGKLIIGSISRAYKDILSEQAEPDYVNINCPIGKDSQLEKHAVCKITYRSEDVSYLCSGALLNNVRQDGIPYFLTANHCIRDTAEAATMVAYFNYENTGCDGSSTTLVPSSISGASLLSTFQPSDYTLLLLNDVPTDIYQPYYAGWDASDKATRMVTSIHHPKGLTKKLSVDYDSIYSNPVKIPWEGNTVSPVGSHWVIDFDEGITSGGSSGSPLFNSKNQIIGQLHGGDDILDYYGNFSYSYANKPPKYLAIGDYLDPDHTGVLEQDGYSPAGNIPDAFFATKNDQVCVNVPVTFTDYSVFGPYERLWSITPSGFTFLEGTSDTSPDPVLEFLDESAYTIKLELIVDGNVKSTKTSTLNVGNDLNISVKTKPNDTICDCDFEKLDLIASGFQDYAWSVVPQDVDKITLNKSTGDSVVVIRNPGFLADSSYTINLLVNGKIGTCVDTAKLEYEIIKPPNDDIANSRLLNYGTSKVYTNVCASIESGEPVPPSLSCTTQDSWCDEYGTGDNIVENSVWFRFVAGATGRLNISSSGFDNQIALYSADSYSDILDGNYILLAANDDRSESNPAPLIRSANVTPGKTFWIQVDGSGGGLENSFTLTLTSLTSTGTDELRPGSMMVYPQPSTGIIFLKNDELSQPVVGLSVYNATGLCILNKDVNVDKGEIVLDISAWESGIYIAVIHLIDKQYNARIVKF